MTGELPPELKAQGVDIEIVTPCYGRSLQNNPYFSDLPVAHEYFIGFHGSQEHVSILRTELQGVPLNLLRNSTYFETDYSEDAGKRPFEDWNLFRKDYSRPYVDSDQIPFYDDALRFSFFCEACLPLILKKDPDIVHVNDWVLGYLMALMKISGMHQKRILTIHNVGYQGNIYLGLIQGWKIRQIVEHKVTGPLFADPRAGWHSVNALRLAMELAHRTNTVSPTYKKEITRPEDQSRFFEGGKGLHEVAARLDHQGKLHGILNGFRYQFTPDEARFENILNEKLRMKAALTREFSEPDALLLGFVGRAVEQKFKLLAEELNGRSILEHILDMPGVNITILTTGDPGYETFLKNLSDRPNLSTVIAYDAKKARQISLGSDVFLMPSLSEPCGITQLESLSLATPPLVRWTGGLADTVRPHTDASGTGFGFDGHSREEVLNNLIGVVNEARQLYTQNRTGFHGLQRSGFYERFLWASSAGEYIEKLYEPALAGA